MKKLNSYRFIIVLLILGLGITVHSQSHPDFTVTDTDGIERQLYRDFLDKGVTVVVKLFFVDCPPCNAIAPDVQALYEQWGEGAYDVEFMEFTTNRNDDNADVERYKVRHNITFIGVSEDGGSSEVVNIYRNQTFGPYFGTPSFAVITPDGSTVYGNYNDLSRLSDDIAATGATGMEKEEVPTTSYRVNFDWSTMNPGNTDGITAIFSSADGTFSRELPISEGVLEFTYPSEELPEVASPLLSLTYDTTTDIAREVTGQDILVYIRHILGVNEITEPDRLSAGDVNSDGRISGADILVVRRLILGLRNAFPNDTPSYRVENGTINVTQDPGNTVEHTVRFKKVGDISS